MGSIISFIRYKRLLLTEILPLLTILGYFILSRIKAGHSESANRSGRENGRTQSGSDRIFLMKAVVIICYLFICAVIYMETNRMMTSGSGLFFRDNRLLFYLVLLALFVLTSILAKRYPKLLYLIVFEVAAIIMIRDLKFSVIDEGAHTDIIQYILRFHHFPTVYENYEAVQGPVYYYLMCLLVWWMPEQVRFIGCRFFGLLCLYAFGYLVKKLLDYLKEKNVINCPPELISISWLLFALNPHVIIRFTRVSNESLMCVMSAFVILKMTEVLVEQFDKKKVILCTVICAVAFLTKSTSVFLFGLIILACIYYRQWKFLLFQVLIYLLIVSPWFISNYITYGALTAMEGHLKFVLPIINPEMVQPDLWRIFLGMFGYYFLMPEAGPWYDYEFFDAFVKALMLIALIISSVISFRLIVNSIRNKLHFTYSETERGLCVSVSYTALFVAAILMHTVQSLITWNNTLGVNRYYFMINGAFCALYLIGSSDLSEQKKHILRYATCFFYAVVILSMVCGYLEILLLRY